MQVISRIENGLVQTMDLTVQAAAVKLSAMTGWPTTFPIKEGQEVNFTTNSTNYIYIGWNSATSSSEYRAKIKAGEPFPYAISAKALGDLYCIGTAADVLTIDVVN